MDAHAAENAILKDVPHGPENTFKWREFVDPNNPKTLDMKRLFETFGQNAMHGFQLHFFIFMDKCDGTIQDIANELRSNPIRAYALLKEIVYQLTMVYNATKLIYTDMKGENVLYSMNTLYANDNPLEY